MRTVPPAGDRMPDTSPVALLLIDVINDLDFPGAESLFEFALPMAKAMAELKRRARDAGIPTIYVNDNFGHWQSDFHKLIDHCLEPECRGRPIVERLLPNDDDYFVLKPKHSGFYSTTLEVLLGYLGAHTLILAGLAGNICVLFTANDAYMRDFRLVVPRDCIASNTRADNEYALQQMERVLHTETTLSSKLDLAALKETKTLPARRSSGLLQQEES